MKCGFLELHSIEGLLDIFDKMLSKTFVVKSLSEFLNCCIDA